MKHFIYSMACCLLFAAASSLHAQSVITGQVMYHDAWPISSAKLYLINTTTSAVVDSTNVDSSGVYLFSQVPAGNYAINVASGIVLNSVDLADALLVIQYLSPGQNITLSNIQKKAVDMNEDGQISMSDAIAIIHKWLNSKKNKNGEEEDWVYVNDLDSDTITNSGTPGDTLDLAIAGAPAADGTGTGSGGGPQKKPSAITYFAYAGKAIADESSKTLEIPVRIAESFEATAIGLGLNLNSPGSGFIGFEPVLSGCEIRLDPQHMRLSWVSPDGIPALFKEGDVIGIIRISAPRQANEKFQIVQDITTHVMGSDGKLLKGIFFQLPELGVETQPPSLKANFPNPFSLSTTIPFELAQGGHVELRILDLQGRHVASLVNESLEAGRHSVVFNRQSLVSGTYIIELNLQDNRNRFRLTKQILLTD